jgi:opacity protein-like surface antigen
MKKAFFVTAFLAAEAVCFAQPRGNIEFYGGSALFNETSGLNGTETVYDSVSVSLGISGGVSFTDFIGLKAYLDFLIPVLYNAGTDGGNTIHKDDYRFLLGMDELFGVAFNVIKTERLTVPLILGLHGKLFFSSIGDYFTAATNSGIGVGVGIEYAVTQKVYLLARINGSFDFIGLSLRAPDGDAPAEAQTRFDAAVIRTWGFAPHIGVGIKL